MLITGTTVDVVRTLATVAGPVTAVNQDQTNEQANSRNAAVKMSDPVFSRRYDGSGMSGVPSGRSFR